MKIITSAKYKKEGEDVIVTLGSPFPKMLLSSLDCEEGIASLKRALKLEGEYFISGSSIAVGHASLKFLLKKKSANLAEHRRRIQELF